jgi:hypothetical protein
MSFAEKITPTQVDPPPASDEQVRALLERYKCTVPFHEARARFLGNIARPAGLASRIRVVEELWGGQLRRGETVRF